MYPQRGKMLAVSTRLSHKGDYCRNVNPQGVQGPGLARPVPVYTAKIP